MFQVGKANLEPGAESCGIKDRGVDVARGCGIPYPVQVKPCAAAFGLRLDRGPGRQIWQTMIARSARQLEIKRIYRQRPMFVDQSVATHLNHLAAVTVFEAQAQAIFLTFDTAQREVRT